jgi:chromatin segregation and condensation protein Rec8/ScpA/Scc1 (kleisin family)
MIGIFLAVLELVRHNQVLAEQNELFGEIWLLPNLNAENALDLSHVDNYDHAAEKSN